MTLTEESDDPRGYVAWHAWAGLMHRLGYRQLRCPCCARFRFVSLLRRTP